MVSRGVWGPVSIDTWGGRYSLGTPYLLKLLFHYFTMAGTKPQPAGRIRCLLQSFLWVNRAHSSAQEPLCHAAAQSDLHAGPAGLVSAFLNFCVASMNIRGDLWHNREAPEWNSKLCPCQGHIYQCANHTLETTALQLCYMLICSCFAVILRMVLTVLTLIQYFILILKSFVCLCSILHRFDF